MKLSTVFNVFSRHNRHKPNIKKPIGESFRNRVLFLCNDKFGNVDHEFSGGDNRAEFWTEIRRRLQYRHGRAKLSDDPRATTPEADTFAFLLTCSDEHFLDFVQYIFRTVSAWRISAEERNMVGDINLFFEVDDLPYYLTGFVRESNKDFSFGREREISKVVSYPQVICRDDQVPHMTAIEPTLILLSQDPFQAANDEFREALEDYRKRDYADCLTKCCSALESVMKIICERRGWTYQQTDTASGLLKTIFKNRSDLPPFLEQPLLIVATIRNRLSNAHGAGSQKRSVSQSIAKFAINSTAAGILLLAEEASQLIEKNT